MIKLLIASTARIRRIIDVMITAHVSSGRLMSHTRPCDMMLRATTSWCGDIGSQIEGAAHCVGCSNLNSRSRIGIHHTTSTTAGLLRAKWVWGGSHQHQVVTLRVICGAGSSSCLWTVIALTKGLLVVVGFFIERVLSWAFVWIILWRSCWVMILMLHLLLLSC